MTLSSASSSSTTNLKIHRIVQEIPSATDDIRPVGQGANGREGIELCEQVQPDIVLMDVVMTVMDGIKATKAISECLPDLKILVLSSYQDHESAYAMLQDGAVGFITKISLAADLAKTIRTAQRASWSFPARSAST